MAKGKKQDPNLKMATCDKCGVKSMAVVGKRHRRCTGHHHVGILPKTTRRHPKAKRGMWK
jgi:hypothetical protein